MTLVLHNKRDRLHVLYYPNQRYCHRKQSGVQVREREDLVFIVQEAASKMIATVSVIFSSAQNHLSGVGLQFGQLSSHSRV